MTSEDRPLTSGDGSEVHELKTWPDYFQAIVEGRKTFELRLNDRGFTEGDRVFLREYDPATGLYSGRNVVADVGYVLAESCAAIPDFAGHVVFSVHNVQAGFSL